MRKEQTEVMRLIGGNPEHWRLVCKSDDDSNFMACIATDYHLEGRRIEGDILAKFIALAEKYQQSANIPQELIDKLKSEMK